MINTWLASPFYLYPQSTEKVGEKHSLGCFVFFKKSTNIFKLVLKLVSNKNVLCTSSAICVSQTCWKLNHQHVSKVLAGPRPFTASQRGCTNARRESRTGQHRSPNYHWTEVLPNSEVRKATESSKGSLWTLWIKAPQLMKKIEKLVITHTLPRFGKRQLFTICIQQPA